jgi:hypothetical protein
MCHQKRAIKNVPSSWLSPKLGTQKSGGESGGEVAAIFVPFAPVCICDLRVIGLICSNIMFDGLIPDEQMRERDRSFPVTNPETD